jgi:precorrin-2/cobalt-factor-2 C20-methyltransferase
MPECKTGKLYGVGLGPGDPELLTMKAHRILSRAAVIFAPVASREKDSYALKIIAELAAGPGREIVRQVFPMTRDETKLKASRKLAGEEIWQRLAGGKDCAFITEGDPMLYSTFTYVLEYFNAHHPEVEIEIIPGITSATAAAASLKIPLAKQGESLAIYPVGYDDSRLEQVLDNIDTVALYKTFRDKDRVLEILRRKGLADSTVFAANVSRPEERLVTDMAEIESDDIDYFSLLIVNKPPPD